MSCEIDLIGVDDLLAKLEALGKKGNKAITKALEKGAEPILDTMKNTDMFDDHSGRLRESIKVSNVKTRKSGKYIWIGDVDRVATHGWYVEFGSSTQAARPFMRDTWNRKKKQAQEIIKEELRKGLEELEQQDT